MSTDHKIKALELAVLPNAPTAETVARAAAYEAFLNGAATQAAKPATAAAKTAPAAPKTPAATGKPAGKPAAKPGAAKAPAASKVTSVHSSDEVLKAIRAVANDTRPGLGMKAASDILDEAAGVANFSALKPENYDEVFDALTAKLAEVDGGAPETATEGGDEFDPTA